MDLHMKLALASLSCVLLMQVASCDGSTGGNETTRWTCVCAAHPLGEPNSNSSLSSNCSSSCHCQQDENGGTGSWNCTCTSDKALWKEEHAVLRDRSCFTSCNCTSGSSEEGKRHVSNKTVIVTLLVCVILTTTAFLVTTVYYFRRKDALSPRSQMYSFDKYTSWSSRSNLISHRSSPLPQPKLKPRLSVLKEFLCSCPIICGGEGASFPGIIVRFSYTELEQATGKFSDEHLIGAGGSSKVYRGQLSDGKVVAVKKLRPLGGADEDYEFLSEIELLSRLNHCHVVPLLGYCSESQGRQLERLLVFECMSNGNLRDCLDLKQGRKPMDWQTRVSVALGAARGLEYLHEAAAPRILHRDIKSTNILLDDKFRAKITDLGMAKCLMNDGVTSCSSSPARMLGTFGYFAPEYAIVGKASLKSDVFSFGVVILELITGRPPIHKSLSTRADESLVIWATSRLRDSRLVVTELPDPALQGRFPAEEMQIMAHLARECLQWDPEARPTMTEVVHMLSTIAPLHGAKRRNLPMAAAFNLTTPPPHVGRCEAEADDIERQQECSSSVQWQQARCAPPSPPPGRASWPGDRVSAVNKGACAGAVVSGEMVNGMLLMSPHGWSSWRPPPDEELEAVDLTEPRLETFTQPAMLRYFS
ncbi:receptor-like serine/threonine-protein kinase NCRK [Phragmites australis]|uniref:receptor-like serine/threonine-protein kinase NCRK n=1 Tax=Phragmites australis TaxID=29695 RepID=UPI002D7918D1|nr:receptor-like serine/threonine-protein kinase NCRK [Phragmites australis]XP_062224349.1 receptor-like serine/threonine-protein kinase NCRK [Phragmites australis]XP_062224350.1 receptor-like serine/threonine-protein kinase NCRK [Phragmites australis]XP_062224351.1 receptor-like serine/threonine-protein kinase NCRK [Phragmites australis]XP_062224352.1 receptor-like serine/threonine-protein kinase NCRK [Phragmites australis]XP_062224353.1 receptor-like serine/threonine-protein kinase NCRK [Phr